MNKTTPPGPVTANIACFMSILMWSITFPAGEVLLETWGSLALLSARMGPAVIAMVVIWALVESPRAVLQAPWLRGGIFVGGLGFGIGSVFFLVGQKMSDAVMPAIAVAMMPIFGAMLEVAFDNRRLRLHLVVGLSLALSGGYLATGVNFADATFGLGALYCLIAVILFAWATRAATRNFPTLTPIGQTAVTFGGGLVFVLLAHGLALAFGLGETAIGLTDQLNISLLAVSALVGVAAAQTLWIWGAGGLGIMLASFHMNALPFYVMIILVTMMNEPWNWAQAFGALLVGLGVLTAQSRKRDRARAET